MASLDKRLTACYDERMNKPLTKHTPGPWIIGKQDHDVITVDTANGTAICDVYVDSDDRPANARLIAAAPDLLEALLAAHGYLVMMGTDHADHIRGVVRDAIAAVYLDLNEWQATAIKTSLTDERPNISHSDVVARIKARSAIAKAKGE